MLTQWWKTFACSQRLEREQILHFRFNGENTLFVKIFQYLCGCAECSAESESSGEDDSSSSEEEEDEDSSGIKAEPVDSSTGYLPCACPGAWPISWLCPGAWPIPSPVLSL